MLLSEIVNVLSKPIPAAILEEKRLGGKVIKYLPWYKAAEILNKVCVWEWEIKSVTFQDSQLFMVGRLTIRADDGTVFREATGTSSLSETGYGDPSSNAESMAFRRAAAKFGLALHLYDKH